MAEKTTDEERAERFEELCSQGRESGQKIMASLLKSVEANNDLVTAMVQVNKRLDGHDRDLLALNQKVKSVEDGVDKVIDSNKTIKDSIDGIKSDIFFLSSSVKPAIKKSNLIDKAISALAAIGALFVLISIGSIGIDGLGQIVHGLVKP